MKSFLALPLLVGLLAGCGASAPPPSVAGGSDGPLRASFDGNPFVPRGVFAKRNGAGIDVIVYDRAAACGTPSEKDLPGEHSFDLLFDQWPMATSDRHLDANSPGIGLNAMKKVGGATSSSSLAGYLEITAASTTGGTLVLHARNDDASLDGELQFVICN